MTAKVILITNRLFQNRISLFFYIESGSLIFGYAFQQVIEESFESDSKRIAEKYRIDELIIGK